jgi:hypothetical protein
MPRVVFVLGAGASRPYGLPTSKELRTILLGTEAGDRALISLGINFDRIVSFIDSRGMRDEPKYGELFARATDREIPTDLNVARLFVDAALDGFCVGRGGTLKNFRHRLFNSQRVSIDAFITNNPDLEKIAKHAVAAVLLLCEREERLEADWYQQFLERLMRGGAHDGEFGVITFNYDRSFEHYFKRAYAHNYLSDELLASKLYRQLKILHAYGCLGTLEGTIMPPLVRYGDVNTFGDAVDQMELATPAHSPNDNIKGLLDGVERVVFIGFGFWKENMDLIELDKKDPPSIYASAFRLPVTVMEDVKARYPNIIFGNRDDHVLDFVLSHPVFA